MSREFYEMEGGRDKNGKGKHANNQGGNDLQFTATTTHSRSLSATAYCTVDKIAL